MPVRAKSGGQGRVRSGRIGAQVGSGSSPSPPGGGTPITFDPARSGTNAILSNSNRDIVNTTTGTWTTSFSTSSKSTGKWYAELVAVNAGTGAFAVGFGDSTVGLNSYMAASGVSAMVYMPAPATDFVSGVTAGTYPTNFTPTTNDVYMFAFDFGTHKAWIGRNGTWFNSSDPVAETVEWINTIPAGSYFFGASVNGDSGATVRMPSTTAFTAPSGYSVWNA